MWTSGEGLVPGLSRRQKRSEVEEEPSFPSRLVEGRGPSSGRTNEAALAPFRFFLLSFSKTFMLQVESRGGGRLFYDGEDKRGGGRSFLFEEKRGGGRSFPVGGNDSKEKRVQEVPSYFF